MVIVKNACIMKVLKHNTKMSLNDDVGLHLACLISSFTVQTHNKITI